MVGLNGMTTKFKYEVKIAQRVKKINYKLRSSGKVAYILTLRFEEIPTNKENKTYATMKQLFWIDYFWVALT